MEQGLENKRADLSKFSLFCSPKWQSAIYLILANFSRVCVEKLLVSGKTSRNMKYIRVALALGRNLNS